MGLMNRQNHTASIPLCWRLHGRVFEDGSKLGAPPPCSLTLRVHSRFIPATGARVCCCYWKQAAREGLAIQFSAAKDLREERERERERESEGGRERERE